MRAGFSRRDENAFLRDLLSPFAPLIVAIFVPAISLAAGAALSFLLFIRISTSDGSTFESLRRYLHNGGFIFPPYDAGICFLSVCSSSRRSYGAWQRYENPRKPANDVANIESIN